MKTKTSMNKKMFLALAVVAALAAVSFVGIALPSVESVNAETYVSIDSENVIIDGESGIVYSFYVKETGPVSGALSVQILSKASSGTLNIGVLDKDNKYTVKATLTLSNAKDVVIGVDADIAINEYYFTLANNDVVGKLTPSGDFTLTQGVAKLGDGAVPFHGIVKAGTFSVDSVYTDGAVVSYDGTKASIAGSVSYIEPTYDDTLDDPLFYNGKLTLSGAASVESALVGNTLATADNVKLTVADGAVITVGDVLAKHGDVEISLGTVATALPYAGLLDGGKIIKSGNLNGAGDKLIFSNVVLGKSYDVLFIVDVGTGDYRPYYGTLRTSGSGDSYSASLGADRLTGYLDLLGANAGAISVPTVPPTTNPDRYIYYDGQAGYTVLAASALADNDSATWGPNSQIKFASDVLTGDRFAVVLSKSSSILLFVGIYNGANFTQFPGFNAPLTVKSTSGTPAAGEIKIGSITLESLYAQIDIAADISSTVDSDGNTVIIDTTAEIIGKIVVKHNANNTAVPLVISGTNSITNDPAPGAKVTGNGVVEHGVAPGQNFQPLAGNVISAAWYVENVPATGTPTATTYYYTTLENAIGKSDEIHITGDLVILETKTIGTDTATKIFIDSGASLTIGNDDKSPIVTIPGNTDIFNDSGRADGYNVANGQAVFDKAKADEATFAAPRADVKLDTGSKVIYTDVSTALSLATSGQTIVLLQDAWISKDSTIPAGVTLKDAPGASLSISKGAALTVIGTLTSATASTGAAGLKEKGIIGNVIVENGGKVTYDGAAYEFSGLIDVKAGGSLSFATIGASTNVGPKALKAGSISVAGTATFGASTTKVANVTIDNFSVIKSGVATIDGSSNLTVLKEVTIGSPAELLTALANPATVDGEITLDAAARAIVYGESTFTESNIASAIVLKTVFQIGAGKASGKTYATEYANDTTTASKKYLYAIELKDYELKGWYEDILFTTAVNPSAPGLVEDITLYGNFVPKKYEVTLSYNEGVQWVVNGIGKGTSGLVEINYGDSVRVEAKALPGYTGAATITANGSSYTAGSAYTVTAPVAFVASGVSPASSDSGNVDNGLTLIEILLIIIVIIIAIIMIVVAIKLLRS